MTRSMTPPRDDPAAATLPEHGTRLRDALLVLATVAYLVTAGVLAVAPVPLSQRFALVQTFALFVCGVVIVRRTATPIIGWLLIVPGVTFNLIYDAPPDQGGMLTGAGGTAFDTLPTLGLLALALLLLVFPSGRPTSTIARAAAWFAVVTHVALIPVQFLSLAGVIGMSVETGFTLESLVFVFIVVIGLVEQVRSYRRRPRVEQLQLKWFIVAIAGQLVYLVMLVVGIEPGTVAFAVFDNAATMLWPITILLAITRYRLYDVDQLISRTVAYAVVVATLAFLGIGGVVVVTSLLPAQDRLAVALSTVIVVALFDPLRRRVIGAVDRRFDRRRYVAGKVVEDFGRQVQDITDVAEISDQVRVVVSRTVAPTTVAVWRPPDAPHARHRA